MPSNNSQDIKIIRTYQAPLEKVWQAWVDPAQAAQWWGPRGFKITHHSKELRVGGHWHYTMHGPDGVDYPNRTKYFEVVDKARLVYDHGANDQQPAMFRVTVDFSELNGATKMDMTMTLPTPEAAAETRKFIKAAGGDATWDRLAEYLEKQKTGNEIFVINRSFPSNIHKMYKAWSDPQELVQWLAPTGAEMLFFRSDIKTGGSAFYKMSGVDGYLLYGRTSYLELKAPHLLLYTQQFCDVNEKITRHPMAPTWPETMITKVELTEEGPDQTRVTVTWKAYGPATAEEITTFASARAGMTMGWTGSFDKLEAYLKV